MISRITPIFPVLSIDEAIEFYMSIGFEYDFHYHLDGDREKPKIFAALRWKSQSLHIQRTEETSKNGAYLMHDDIMSLQKALQKTGLRISYGSTEKPCNTRELHIQDPWGNELSFAEYLTQE